MHIKKGDTVQVISGDDAGTNGRVLRVLPDKGKVVVEGVNRVYKHLKPSRRNPQGGRLQKEMPLDAAKVLLYCPTCRKGVRIGRRYSADGAKERFCKKCTNGLGALSKARETYAKGTK
jgi:large subunit ribosomal protein L24